MYSVTLTNPKQKLRAQVRKKRTAMEHATHVEKSRRIAERLLTSPEFARAEVIHIYLATNTEVQTDAILEKALLLGKRVVAPVMDPPNLRLFEVLSIEKFQMGPFGIREPLRHKEVMRDEVDLWILPGVAYDIQGNRLRSGGGYYDHLFAGWDSADSVPLRIALAFELQICDRIPMESTDCRVDQMITEERTIVCTERSTPYGD